MTDYRDREPQRLSASSGGSVSRFLGGSPLGVLLRLVLLCVIVGLVLDQLDLNAMQLFRWAVDALDELLANSADAIRIVLRYFLIGAAVVVPVWLILRLLKVGSGRR